MSKEKRYKIIAREIDFVDGFMRFRCDDYGEETHRALQEAVEIITALSDAPEREKGTLEKIKEIIDIPNTVIQEDVMKYKMICEVVENDN
jgi:hypothetical protein